MTRARQVNFPEVKTDVIPFDGGLNESVSSIEMKAGELILCKNYYITEGSTGGYVSVQGYERFDGRTSPSTVPATAEDHTARDAARTAIIEVPGVGPAIASYHWKGVTYAFRNKVGEVTAGMYKSTAAGWVEVDTSADPLAPNGRYSFTEYSYEILGGDVLLWTNGVDNAKIFNGTVVTSIVNTGMGAEDKPVFLVATWDRIVLSYAGGSLQLSKVGDPRDWSLGTLEFQTGYDITSITPMMGDTVIITGRSQIQILRRTETGYAIENFSDAVGAISYTVQKLFDTLIFMSDMGVTTLQASQDFGDFGTASVSEKIKRTLLKYKDRITCSVVVRQLNQYRLYFDNGKALVFSFYNKKLRGVTLIQYPTPVLSASESKDINKSPIMFFTSLQGYIYQMERGTSFDGGPIDTRMSTAYYHYKSPRNWKRFQQITLEVATIDELTFGVRPSFDYGAVGTTRAAEGSFDLLGAGSVWGEDIWGTMTWSGSESTNRVMYRFSGIGSNMSITLYTEAAYNRQHTIQDLITDYTIIGRQM